MRDVSTARAQQRVDQCIRFATQISLSSHRNRIILHLYKVTTLPGSSEEGDNNSLKASDSEVMVLKYTGASISNGAGNLGRAAGGRKDGLVELADVLASIKRSIVKVGEKLSLLEYSLRHLFHGILRFNLILLL